MASRETTFVTGRRGAAGRAAVAPAHPARRRDAGAGRDRARASGASPGSDSGEETTAATQPASAGESAFGPILPSPDARHLPIVSRRPRSATTWRARTVSICATCSGCARCATCRASCRRETSVVCSMPCSAASRARRPPRATTPKSSRGRSTSCWTKSRRCARVACRASRCASSSNSCADGCGRSRRGRRRSDARAGRSTPIWSRCASKRRSTSTASPFVVTGRIDRVDRHPTAGLASPRLQERRAIGHSRAGASRGEARRAAMDRPAASALRADAAPARRRRSGARHRARARLRQPRPSPQRGSAGARRVERGRPRRGAGGGARRGARRFARAGSGRPASRRRSRTGSKVWSAMRFPTAPAT